MDKIKIILGASIILFGQSANAALIERTFDYTITNDLIFDTVDNAGNQGKEIEFYTSTDPFFLSAGDTLSTRINFDRPLRIKNVANNKFWASSGGSVINSEPFSFIYWFTDSTSGTGSNANANVSYSVSFDIFSGNLASTYINGNLNTAGGGTSAASTIRSNITDSVVNIIGIDILTNINNYTLNRNDGEYGFFMANLRAGDLRVLSVPAPAAIWLFLTGLVGLGIARRRVRG